jgi:hypothetical protein
MKIQDSTKWLIEIVLAALGMLLLAWVLSKAK